MGNSSDWFAKKLGGGPARAPAPPPPTRSTPTPGYEQRPVPGQQMPPPQEDGERTFSTLLTDEERARKASRAERFETEVCPGCGSKNYFSRAQPGQQMRPTPQCYDCGYPTIQYGSNLGEGGAIQQTQGLR